MLFSIGHSNIVALREYRLNYPPMLRYCTHSVGEHTELIAASFQVTAPNLQLSPSLRLRLASIDQVGQCLRCSAERGETPGDQTFEHMAQ